MIARHLLRLVALLLLTCTVTISTVRGIVQAVVKPTPTHLETGDCEQPCWKNLRPGIINSTQFFFKARSYSPYSGRVNDRGDDVVRMFEVYTYGAVSLGDLVREFGAPERVSCLDRTHTTLYSGQQQPALAANVYFAGGLVVANITRGDERTILTPDMSVRSVQYYAPGEPTYPIGETTPWYGFASERRYRACNP